MEEREKIRKRLEAVAHVDWRVEYEYEQEGQQERYGHWIRIGPVLKMAAGEVEDAHPNVREQTRKEKQIEGAVIDFLVNAADDIGLLLGLVFCYLHMKWEEAGDNPYLVCFECKHPYKTEQDLIDAYNQVTAALKHPMKSVDDITFCPHCAHDF